MAKNAAVEPKVVVADLETEAKALEAKADKTKDQKTTKAEETEEPLKTLGMKTREALKTKVDKTKDRAVVVVHDMKMKANETKDRAVVVVHDMKKKAHETKDAALTILHDPHFQTCTVATTGGALTFGMAGGAFGAASGLVVGSAAGVLPALFTFGLSIPAGGAIGGSCGLCTGTLLGCASGGIGGFTTYKYRIEIKDGLITIKVRAQDTFNGAKKQVVMVSSTAKTQMEARVWKLQASISDVATSTKKHSVEAVDLAKKHSAAAVDMAKDKASKALTFATKTKAGVTSSSAVAGAVVGGTSTGAFGTFAGAALGIPAAIFTFGLSIPAGAMVGLCVGTAVGGSAGAVGGGLAGYGGFTHGKAISEGVQSSCSKVTTKAEELKTKTFTCAKSMIRARAGTGGSSEEAE